jgi:hypothetical protein
MNTFNVTDPSLALYKRDTNLGTIPCRLTTGESHEHHRILHQGRTERIFVA